MTKCVFIEMWLLCVVKIMNLDFNLSFKLNIILTTTIHCLRFQNVEEITRKTLCLRFKCVE